MLYGGIVITDYFRNYVPVAPDLTAEVISGQAFDITIKDFLLQGARDQETHESPTPGILEKVPVQRGWRLRPIIVEPPRHGTVTWDPFKGSFTYTATLGYEGEDCYTYVLTNGYQKSLMAQVLIQVEKSYTISIPTIQRNEAGQYTILTEFYKPPSEPNPLFAEYIWSYPDYFYVDNSSGVNRVFNRKEIFYRTAYTSDLSTGNYPNVSDNAKRLSNFVPQSNEGISGLIENTDIPYRARVLPYNILLQVRMYFTHKTVRTFTGSYVNGEPTYYQRKVGLDYSKYTTIQVLLNKTPFGPQWTQSGNIEQI